MEGPVAWERVVESEEDIVVGFVGWEKGGLWGLGGLFLGGMDCVDCVDWIDG